MAAQDSITIAVAVDRLEHMFREPEADPLAGRFETTSGIDEVLQQLMSVPRRNRRKCHIDVSVGDPGETRDAAVLKTAIAGYCDERVADIERSLAQSLHAGRQALWLGLGFLGVCLILSGTFRNLDGIPDFFRQLFGEGFNIAGWVGLWRPIELLLYDSWPFRRDLRLLRLLPNLPVTLARLPAAPATAAAATARGATTAA